MVITLKIRVLKLRWLIRVFISLYLLAGVIDAQGQTPVSKDSTFRNAPPANEKKTRIEQGLEKFASKKNIFSRLLRSVMIHENAKPLKPPKKAIEHEYYRDECKVIRKIDIIVLGPFGYSVTENFGHNINE